MSQVDFYILSDGRGEAVPRQACSLIDETWQQAEIYVHTATISDTLSLDKLLWTWRQDSFIPHETVVGEEIPRAPVLLGNGEIPPVSCPVLINLSNRMPERGHRFERIIEIIAVQEDLRSAGRSRFKAYRAQGHALQTHNL